MQNTQVVSISSLSAQLKTYQMPVDMNAFDSFVINSVTFGTSNLTDSMYFLWCSYTNSYVCSFVTSNGFSNPVIPNLEIRIKNPISTMRFTLYMYDGGNIVEVPAADAVYVSIILNFIKY